MNFNIMVSNLTKLTIVLVVFMAACNSGVKSKDKETEKILVIEKSEPLLSSKEKKGQEILIKCMNAHGGLDKWRQYKTLEYDLIDHGNPSYQIIDLNNRNIYHKTKQYELGFDGKNAWVLPNREAFSGESILFFHNIDFYFFGIPFLIADPGVHSTYDGQKTVNDKVYDVLKISFGKEIGTTPEDVYYMLIDSITSRMEILLYTVTFFDKNSEILGAKVYEEWQEIDGFVLPKKMENYFWNDNDLGENKHHPRVFTNIKISKEEPDSKRFEAPEGAFVEMN